MICRFVLSEERWDSSDALLNCGTMIAARRPNTITTMRTSTRVTAMRFMGSYSIRREAAIPPDTGSRRPSPEDRSLLSWIPRSVGAIGQGQNGLDERAFFGSGLAAEGGYYRRRAPGC